MFSKASVSQGGSECVFANAKIASVGWMVSYLFDGGKGRQTYHDADAWDYLYLASHQLLMDETLLTTCGLEWVWASRVVLGSWDGESV